MLDNLEFFKLLEKKKLIAVIREKNYLEAKKQIDYAISGGVKLIEVTITTPKAFLLVKQFSKKYQELFFGTGSVVTYSDAVNSIKNGAKFLVSPHFSNEVSLASIEYKIPYIPGVMTVSEAMNAMQKHFVIKLFPASVLSPKFIEDIKKPLPFLNIMPSGGVSTKNVEEWLDSGAIAVSIGSSLFEGKNSKEITKNIRFFVKKCQS